ncbi:hypothetical protein O6H91_08G050900 [Diphasiastrum complanatum]|nr:hypothetical protein O6H91_08G050900 [Diphasiastrum complanatum]
MSVLRRLLNRRQTMKRFPGFIQLQIICLLLFWLSICSERAAVMCAARNRLDVAAHSNFVKANYMTESKFQHYVWCFKNASICLDRSRNPGGGTTCCWNTFCQDTHRDKNHCGACGRPCRYGHTCCYGQCTDLLNDRHHCGSCESCCSENEQCEFGMCGYGGYNEATPNSLNPKHW